MEKLHNWAIAAAAATYAAVLTALIASGTKFWIAVAMASFSFAALLVFACVILVFKPRVRIQTYEVSDTVGASGINGATHFIWLHLKNTGRYPINHAWVELNFYNYESGSLIHDPIPGRWSNGPKNRPEEATTVAWHQDFIGGATLRVDLAIKPQVTNDIFALNDRSAHLHGRYADPSRLIGEGPLFVKVQTRGDGLTIKPTFLLLDWGDRCKPVMSVVRKRHEPVSFLKRKGVVLSSRTMVSLNRYGLSRLLNLNSSSSR